MVKQQYKEYENCEGYTEKDINKVLIEDTLMCDGHHQRKIKIIGFIWNKEKTQKSMVIEDIETKEKEVFYSGELNHTHLQEINTTELAIPPKPKVLGILPNFI